MDESRLETGYQPLFSYDDNGEETPQENVVIHVVPESSKARWNHIEDLDAFFTRVYQYHQNHGFLCMVTQDVLVLLQFLFIIFITTYLFNCVDFPILFHEKVVNGTSTKVKWNDALIPIGECSANLHAWVIFCLIVAFIVWLLRVVKVVYHFFQFLEIKAFYASALRINEADLDNMTWHEVQARMQEVQREQQMCIHKTQLTELDIYHRILRFKNYMVAMVNKSLLPLRYTMPWGGDHLFLSQGLKYNLEMILFWGPWAPFENSWHLKADYKKPNKRKELAQFLSKRILWIGIANFVLCPLIFAWRVLYAFFTYAEGLKREPGILGARRWSLYGRLYLRHFNELDHELYARLNRGYRPASKYVSIFSSHLMAIVAKNVIFVFGSMLTILVILTVYDEDVLQVEHVLSTITILGVVVAGCRVLIPDENLVWCPEKLMTSVLAHIHYVPDHWRGNAHTTKVRDEFADLFQYKAVYLLEELFSPLVTPIILCFFLRHKALDIVDFFRNFTVDVMGVGDVCSFAQMDVRKHGNPQWTIEGRTEASQYQQAEDGKTELSLMHFKLTNPHWVPPKDATAFLTNLKQQATRDANAMHYLPEENPLYLSLHSVSSLGAGYMSLANNFFRTRPDHSCTQTTFDAASSASSRNPIVRGTMNHLEGPPPWNAAPPTGLLSSFRQGDSLENVEASASLQFSGGDGQRPFSDDVPLEFTAAEMSFSALYMHELHHRQLRPVVDNSRLLWQRGTVAGAAGAASDMPHIQELPREEEEQAETMPLLAR